MKKKGKLFLSLCTLLFSLGVMCYGVYSAVQVQFNVTGSIMYVAPDVEFNTAIYTSAMLSSEDLIKSSADNYKTLGIGNIPLPLAKDENGEPYIYTTQASYPENEGEQPEYSYAEFNDINLDFNDSNCRIYYIVINIKPTEIMDNYTVQATIENNTPTGNNLGHYETNTALTFTEANVGQNVVIAFWVKDSTQQVPMVSLDINIVTTKVPLVPIQDMTFTFDHDKKTAILKDYTGAGGAVQIPAKIGFANLSSGQTAVEGDEYTVTEIGESTFSSCTTLTSVSIPSTVISIGNSAFEGCSNLTTANLLSGLQSIGERAFYNCKKWTGTLSIPSGVTSIGQRAFYYCSGLTGTVTIPSGVTSIEDYTFYYCSGLSKIDLPSGLKTIGENAFERCTKWTGTLSIPSGVTSIGQRAFYYCSGLTGTVTIPSGVTSIENSTFYYCSGLSKIDLPSGLKTIGEYAFNHCTKWTGTLSIPSGVTSIGQRAFYYCSGLTGVTIPEGVTSIEDHTFYHCSGLSKIDLPSGLKTIGESAFESCSGWTGTLSIPSGVTSIGDSAFESCSSLTSVTIPGSVETIGGSAFSGCTKLASVTIQNGVESIGIGAFGATNLTSLKIPASVTNIVGDNPFIYGGPTLSSFKPTAINVDSSNSFYSSSGGVLFNKDKTIILAYPHGKTATSYTIPSTVKTIGGDAFDRCDNLTSITIPSSVTTIKWAAIDCDNLKYAYFSDTSSKWTVKSGSTSYTISVSSASTAARYLRDDYHYHTWTKN